MAVSGGSAQQPGEAVSDLRYGGCLQVCWAPAAGGQKGSAGFAGEHDGAVDAGEDLRMWVGGVPAHHGDAAPGEGVGVVLVDELGAGVAGVPLGAVGLGDLLGAAVGQGFDLRGAVHPHRNPLAAQVTAPVHVVELVCGHGLRVVAGVGDDGMFEDDVPVVV